ncbi:hypothetical protein L6164_031039 [Bauhinia variegata]|uniref:Uncharacterized protein n=1 Tax=Bauhinia variegata TaxID=167791 RepID=A0ACB9LEQ7_BAUVA|nr:hypothetical protein L6164_031039 [Bauhinia variegata]
MISYRSELKPFQIYLSADKLQIRTYPLSGLSHPPSFIFLEPWNQNIIYHIFLQVISVSPPANNIFMKGSPVGTYSSVLWCIIKDNRHKSSCNAESIEMVKSERKVRKV